MNALDNLAELFKRAWVPGSATFFIIGLILAAVLLYSGRRMEKWGRRSVLALALLGYLLSTPLAASGLVDALSAGYAQLDTASVNERVDAIVVLGGGGSTYQLGGYQLEMLSPQTSLRLLEGLRLYEMLDAQWIVVSGGKNERSGAAVAESETMAQELVVMGVPENRILIEAGSSNTRDQALQVPPLLNAQAVERYVLVTSPAHMRRADLSFRAVGSQHLASLAPGNSQTRPTLGYSPLPNADALEMSRDALREVVGLLYYWLRGWL